METITVEDNTNELRRLQLTQLEMLKVIDSFCKEHHIRYSLYAGTLLGAVRHKGFIPWDDDLDLCMDRSNYDRFIREWLNDGPSGYIIQNKEIEPRFTQSFTKVRKEHTAYLQDENERGQWNTGIFVDIFPIDRIPGDKIRQFFFYFNVLLYQLYTREFPPPLSGRIMKSTASVILKATSFKPLRKKLRQYHYRNLVRYDKDKKLPMVAIEMTATLKQILPRELMKEFVELPFEGCLFPCMKLYKEYLTEKYGDYEQLPPEKDRRWRHHPVILDFEHSIDEL